MKMIVLSCPTCGAALETEKTEGFCTCEFCGSKVMQEKLPFDNKIPATASIDTLLERAYLFLEESDFYKADQYFERILDIDPHCSKAYIGKLLCQLNLCRINDLIYSKMSLSSYDNYNKAVRFASAEELHEYEQLSAAVEERYNQEKLQKEQELFDLQCTIASQEKYLLENKNKYYKANGKKILWKVLLIVSICSVVFWTVGAIVVLPLAIIDIPCILWVILMIRINKSAKLLTRQYDETKLSLQKTNMDLNYKQSNYTSWLLLKR